MWQQKKNCLCVQATGAKQNFDVRQYLLKKKNK